MLERFAQFRNLLDQIAGLWAKFVRETKGITRRNYWGKLMTTLEKAIEIALKAHAGQTDKAGATYILHPLRMMLRMATETEMMAQYIDPLFHR